MTPLFHPDLHVHLMSLGLKPIGGVQGLPRADLYLDARALFDGYGGKGISITKEEKVAAVESFSPKGLQGFYGVLEDALNNMVRRRRGEEYPYARPFTGRRVVCACRERHDAVL